MAYIDTKYLFECETCRRNRTGKCDTWCENGECYQPDMSKIPTADVEDVRHGEWTQISYTTLYKCSVCTDMIDMPYQNKLFDYCPNCGAKMDGTPKERGKEK